MIVNAHPLFGSDMPTVVVTLDSALVQIRQWGRPKAAILGGHAERLLQAVTV